MFKKYWIVLLLVLILIPTNASAAKEPAKEEPLYACGKPLISKDVDKNIDEYKEEDANMADRFIASQIQNLFHIGDVNSLANLVFGNPYCVWMDKDQKMADDGIFTTTEREKIIDPILKLFSGSYTLLLTLAILISSLKMGLKANNPIARQEFWSDMSMWAVSAIFIATYIPLTNLVFNLNVGLVQAIKDTIAAQGLKTDGISIIAMENMDKVTVNPITSLGNLIVFLAEWVLAAVLNLIYIARKITIMLLLMLGYVAAYSLIFPKTKGFFGVWVKELVGNIFLQSIHGLILFSFVMMANTGAGNFMKLGLMVMFIPLSGMISKWLNIGDSSTKLGQTATMMGLGGLAATTMIAKQAGNVMRGGNVFGGSNTATSSLNSGGDLTNNGSVMNAGGASDSAFTAITANAKGENSSFWNSLKTAGGTVGAVVGGSAGMVLGPAGSAAGALVGMKASQGVMQLGRNLSMGGTDAIKSLYSAKNYSGVGGTGFSGMMKDLQGRRSFFGNMGESMGSMVGLGVAGRGLGHALSGVSRQRIAGSPTSQGGTGTSRTDGTVSQMTWGELTQSSPGSNVRFAQTNKESGFFMQNANGDWSKIGATGAADPTLKDGAVRMMDYKVNSGSNPLQLQANGTYKYMPAANPASMDSNIPISSVVNPMASVNPGNVVSPNGINSMVSPGSTVPASSGINSSVSPGSTVSIPSGINSMVSPGTTVPASSGINSMVNPGSTVPTSSGINSVVSSSAPNSQEPLIQSSAPSNQTGTAGLQGSTPHILRTSDAYIVGGGNTNGSLNPTVFASAPQVQRVADPAFKGASINPDSFVAQQARGVDTRSGSDRGADFVHGSKSHLNSAAGWVSNKVGRTKKRNREII